MKTRIHHYRVSKRVQATKGPPLTAEPVSMISGEEINPRGGMTVVFLVDDYGKILSAGVSVCSMSDNYVRSTGVNVARHRARAAFIKEEAVVGPRGVRVSLVDIDLGVIDWAKADAATFMSTNYYPH